MFVFFCCCFLVHHPVIIHQSSYLCENEIGDHVNGSSRKLQINCLASIERSKLSKIVFFYRMANSCTGTRRCTASPLCSTLKIKTYTHIFLFLLLLLRCVQFDYIFTIYIRHKSFCGLFELTIVFEKQNKKRFHFKYLISEASTAKYKYIKKIIMYAQCVHVCIGGVQCHQGTSTYHRVPISS